MKHCHRSFYFSRHMIFFYVPKKFFFCCEKTFFSAAKKIFLLCELLRIKRTASSRCHSSFLILALLEVQFHVQTNL